MKRITIIFGLLSLLLLVGVVSAEGPYDGTPYSLTGAEPLNVTFTDVSTGDPTSWNWTKTDVTGANTPISFSTAQNPTHVFYVGNWSIRLTATNAFGTSTTDALVAFVNVTGTSSIPTANFSADDTTLDVGQVVTLTDTSTGSPTSWSWDLLTADGIHHYFTTRNVSTSFTSGMAGYCTVSLTSTNAAGSDTETKINYLYITWVPDGLTPVANFTPTGSLVGSTYWISVTNGTTLTFNDTSTNTPTSWAWTVTNSSGTTYPVTQNTSALFETFSAEGSEYYVTLTATNSIGSNSITKGISVSAPPVIPIPRVMVDVGGAPYTWVEATESSRYNVTAGDLIMLTDSSYNSPTMWNWNVDMGNGSTRTSTANNYNYSFTDAVERGTYGFTFTASNAAGSATLSLPNLFYVNDITPPAKVSGAIGRTAAPTQIAWNWTNPTDSDLAYISVYKDGVLFENVTGHSTTWTGLTPSTSYAIGLRSVDTTGNMATGWDNASESTTASSWNWTSSGYWVCPDGVTNITLKLTGGGGSGKGGSGGTDAGGGGFAGEAATFSRVDVIPGTNYTITVGLRGENSTYGNPSNAGTYSQFGSDPTYRVEGGLGGVTIPGGGNGTDGEAGAFSTERIAINGTDNGVYTAGVSGLGYGAGGGGATMDAVAPLNTMGGHGAGGFVEITVFEYATGNIPDFKADITSSTAGSLIHFTDLSALTDLSDISYNWSFGDGYYSSTVGDTQHVYSYTGSYDVALVITSGNGTASEIKPAYINIISQDITITAIPRTVTLTCVDENYKPVSGVNVSATPTGFTAPAGWLAQYYGITGVTFNGTTLNGLTGTDGSWAGPMMEAYKYNFSFVKSGMPTYYMDFYPSADSYIIKLPTTTDATPLHELIQYSLYNTTLSSTSETFHATYSDSSGGTSSVSLIVRNTSGVIVAYINNSAPGTSTVTLSSGTITHQAGDSYEYSIYAIRSDSSHVNMTKYLTWERARTLSMFPDWVSQWFGVILLIILAGIFSAISVKFAVVIIPFFAGFLTIYMKMLDPLTGAATFLACLGIIAVIGALKYTREQEKKL